MDKFWRPAMKDGSKKKESYVSQPYETRSGGFRVDENNVEYYLTPSQLQEYTSLNLTIEDDDAFWAAWKAMRERLNLKPYTKVYTYDDDWSKGSDSWWSKSKTTTTDWWGSSYRKGMSWTSDKTQKLAIALQHVISIVRTVDDNTPAMSVRWTADSDGDASYTDFTAKNIHISPEPVQSGKVSDAEALDIVTGYALHEASHALYTKPLMDVVTKPHVIHPSEVSALLMNVLEDPRVEGLTAREYPGFAEYIDKALAYSWTKRPSEANPAIWGNLGQKLNSVIVMARWSKNIRNEKWKTDAKTNTLVMEDASFDPEIPWWAAWLNDYLDGKTLIRDAVQTAIDHLMDKELEERIEQSKAREAAGQELADILGQMKKLMDELGIDSPCDAMEGDPEKDGLTESTRSEVSQLVDSKTKEVHAPDGDHDPRTMFHSRPLETARSQQAGRRKLSPIMQRLKAAIQLRPELPQFEDRMLRSGEIDEEELYRFAANDYRIFEQRITAEHPQASVTLLVDMSGSMNGSTDGRSKLGVAQELAQLFVDALRSMEGVSPKVMGHTGDVTSGGEIQLYELWVPGDNLVRLGLIATLPHSNNYDGHAISWCVQDLLTRARPGDQTVLIVLSDGQPAGSMYGGISGMDHVRLVTEKAEQRGVPVIQIAIDDSLRPAEQSRMFKHWIPYTTMDALPRAFEKVLARAINA